MDCVRLCDENERQRDGQIEWERVRERERLRGGRKKSCCCSRHEGGGSSEEVGSDIFDSVYAHLAPGKRCATQLRVTQKMRTNERTQRGRLTPKEREKNSLAKPLAEEMKECVRRRRRWWSCVSWCKEKDWYSLSHSKASTPSLVKMCCRSRDRDVVALLRRMPDGLLVFLCLRWRINRKVRRWRIISWASPIAASPSPPPPASACASVTYFPSSKTPSTQSQQNATRHLRSWWLFLIQKLGLIGINWLIRLQWHWPTPSKIVLQDDDDVDESSNKRRLQRR